MMNHTTKRIIAFALAMALCPLIMLASPFSKSEAQAASSAPLYKPNQLLISFRKGVSEQSKSEYLGRIGAKSLYKYQLIDAQLIQVNDSRSLESWIRVIKGSPLVRYAEPNYRVELNNNSKYPPRAKLKNTKNRKFSNDPYLNRMWGHHNLGYGNGKKNADIDAPEAWRLYKPEASIIVAVIDSGVDYNHKDLARNIWINPGEDLDKNNLITQKDQNGIDDDGNGYVDDFRGWNFVKWNNNPKDDNGHGTHVAGIIAAQRGNKYGISGVAGNGETLIMPLKFLDKDGSGYISDAIAALEYATYNGAYIANNSWGGSPYNRALYEAIRNYGQFGGLFIVAAGNDGTNIDSKKDYPASYNLPNIITVASITPKDTLSGFSNYGAHSVHVAAPGSNIVSTVPGNKFASYSGTSMATPYVTGVVALIWNQNPYITGLQVKELLMETVRPNKNLTKYTISGGVVNAKKALKRLLKEQEENE